MQRAESMRHFTVLLVSAVCGWCVLFQGTSFAQIDDHHYGLQYNLTLKPEEDRADISLTLDGGIKDTIWSLRFHIDPARHSGFEGDGTIEPEGDYVTWTPPESGGKLTYHAKVSHSRDNGKFDARMTPDWAIFRGDNLFPAAHTQDRNDSQADATLHVNLPEGWSFATAYPTIKDHTYEVKHEHRRFDRPTGWMAAGHLGVRRERIAGVRVIVAGPLHENVRRLDMLALLTWTLPRVKRLHPDMPTRILIVSAGDPMFRGGLSGPRSLFVHSDRPLLSENGSSTLVHELVHVANRLEGEQGGDWIVEGIAEYYSLKLLWRSGTLTDHRYKATFAKYANWAKEVDRLDVDMSSGPVTARAVGIMRKLDREIYSRTNHKKSLDDVVRMLVAEQRKVNLTRLRQAVIEVMGAPSQTLSDEELGPRTAAE